MYMSDSMCLMKRATTIHTRPFLSVQMAGSMDLHINGFNGSFQPKGDPPKKLKGDLRASQSSTTNKGILISLFLGSCPAFAARRARQAFWQNLKGEGKSDGEP